MSIGILFKLFKTETTPLAMFFFSGDTFNCGTFTRGEQWTWALQLISDLQGMKLQGWNPALLKPGRYHLDSDKTRKSLVHGSRPVCSKRTGGEPTQVL